jgi:hypothetical protein
VEDSTTYPLKNEKIVVDKLNEYSIFFEDSGKAAYAYLLKGKDIVSDVWIYNHGLPPAEAEWNDPEKAPFRNPIQKCKNVNFIPVKSADEISFNWILESNDKLQGVEIFIRGTLMAFLSPEEVPGQSKLTLQDGPLSKIFSADRVNK